MKPFAFLCPTPEWAKFNGCGQYNGYLAFPTSAWNLIYDNNDGWESYNLPWQVLDSACEVSFGRPSATLDKFRTIVPVTDIPEEAKNGEPFCVVGYDTCHSWNSWEENTLEHETEVTREWLRMCIDYLSDLSPEVAED